jgi:hypothetical protein
VSAPSPSAGPDASRPPAPAARDASPPDRLGDAELVDLELALDAVARASASVPTGTVAGRQPWETRTGVTALELVGELTTTGARQSRMGAGGGGAATPKHERALPFVATANDLAVELHAACLDLAAAVLRTDAHDAPIGPRRPGPASIHAADVAAWLLTRLDALAWHPGIVRTHARDLVRLVARGRTTVDRRPGRWYAGPCATPLRDEAGDLVIVDGEQAYCDGELYARPEAPVVRCPTCDTGHRVEFRRAELLRLAEDRLETATTLSRALTGLLDTDVRPDRIRQWKRRSRLVSRGHDDNGDPVYRLGDVLDLLKADAARRARVHVAGTRKTPRPRTPQEHPA